MEPSINHLPCHQPPTNTNLFLYFIHSILQYYNKIFAAGLNPDIITESWVKETLQIFIYLDLSLLERRAEGLIYLRYLIKHLSSFEN